MVLKSDDYGLERSEIDMKYFEKVRGFFKRNNEYHDNQESAFVDPEFGENIRQNYKKNILKIPEPSIMNLEDRELFELIDKIESDIHKGEKIDSGQLNYLYFYKVLKECTDELKDRGYSERDIICR